MLLHLTMDRINRITGLTLLYLMFDFLLDVGEILM